MYDKFGGVVECYVKINIRVNGNMMLDELAADEDCSIQERIELNRRGMVLAGETCDGEEDQELPLRVGQCWGFGEGIVEIVGLPEGKAEVMEWTHKGNKKGRRLEVSTEENYGKYPTGMGSRNWIDREVLREGAGELYELGRDCAKGRALTCSVMGSRKRKIAKERARLIEKGEWMKWEGKPFTKIYTDGSWKKENTVASLLLNTGKVVAGGGMVLTDGNFFSPIYVEMDVETESAFNVETIMLIAGYEVGREAERKIELNTDCRGEMSAIKGKNAGYKAILGGWEEDDNIEVRKVKAHPEMWGEKGKWDVDEIGNWMADHIAGGGNEGVRTISAREILRDISRKAKITLVKKDGSPFDGDLRKRNSKYVMRRYYENRDKYRAIHWQDAVWKGTNRCKAQYMCGRNKYIEDRAAVLRLSLAKTWAISRHNQDMCMACGGKDKDLGHALFRCRHLDVAEARKCWKQEVDKCTKKIYNHDIRGVVGEIMMKAMNCRGGEFACVGTLREQFVNQLHLGHLLLTGGEETVIWKAMKVLGQGAREVMRVYSKAAIGEFSIMVQRQGTIREFFKTTKMRKDHRDGVEVKKMAKREKEAEKRKKKPCRKGGIMNPTVVGGVLYWEFKAG